MSLLEMTPIQKLQTIFPLDFITEIADQFLIETKERCFSTDEMQALHDNHFYVSHVSYSTKQNPTRAIWVKANEPNA